MIKSYIPKNIDELFNCLAEMTPNSKIVAGSTDLGIRLQKGSLSPDALLYMGSIKETRDIVEYDKYVEIGAYVTHTELEESPIICKYFTAISDAAKDVGSLQIRNNGTIGGNIANASPAGDLLPVLFMLDTTVVVATKNKELKDIKISEFILGPGKTVLEVGEAIVKFRINKIDDFISAFIKLGSRKKLTISRIGCTIGITFKESTIDDIKIYIGAISLTPVQLKKAKEYLKNENIMELFNIQVKKDISNFMSSLIYEITPEKFDRDYKVWASKAVVFDLFDIVQKRILGDR
ncbi:FAD binding domain-containing protein [Fusobacterium animalis]|uniref:FAD binding domain-containing protein n=1 Tax=Fusobacterium animalis TaxID=76859 RepID=UPI00324A0214